MERMKAQEALASARRAKEERLEKERRFAREHLLPELEKAIADAASCERRQCVWSLPLRETLEDANYNPVVAREVIDTYLNCASYSFQVKPSSSSGSEPGGIVDYQINWDNGWGKWFRSWFVSTS